MTGSASGRSYLLHRSVIYCLIVFVTGVTIEISMDGQWENFVQSIRRFREEVGEQTEDTEKHLSIINTFKQHLEVIEVHVVQQSSQSCQGVMAVKGFCLKIIFSDYNDVSNGVATVSMVYREIKKKESQIPELMQPKFKEFQGYWQKIDARNKEIESLIQKIKNRVRKLAGISLLLEAFMLVPGHQTKRQKTITRNVKKGTFFFNQFEHVVNIKSISQYCTVAITVSSSR